jgi:hypothetical protein
MSGSKGQKNAPIQITALEFEKLIIFPSWKVKKLLTLIIAKRKDVFGNFELAVSEPAGFHVPREAVPVHPADDKRAEEVDDEDGSDCDDQVDDCQLSWVNNYSFFSFLSSNFHLIFNKFFDEKTLSIHT